MNQMELYFCWRTHHDVPGWIWFRDSDNGCGLLRSLDGHSNSNGIPRPSQNGHQTAKAPNAKAKAEPPFQAILDAAKAGHTEWRRLASMLGVSVTSLQQLEVGYEPQTSERDSEHWLFPERDCVGKVIGLTRRYATGRKLQLPGSHRGLTFDPSQNWSEIVLVPEGASDVAAALTMGLCAVGRPNNLGGVELLGALLWPAQKAGVVIVVMAERDEKPDGRWPGLDGAIRTAQRLADAWDQPVGYALPGDDQKDIRSWLVAQKADPNDAKAMKTLGRRFLDSMSVFSFRSKYKNKDKENESVLHPKENTDIVFTIESARCHGPAALEVIRQGNTPRRCPYASVPVLQRKTNVHHAKVLSVHCGCHACTCCGPRLRSTWLTHLTDRMLDTAKPLFFHLCETGKAWEASKRQLRRLKASYAGVHSADDKVTVISTAALDDSPELPPFGAAEHLAEALLNLSRRRKPIATSRDWQRHVAQTKSNLYHRVGSAPEGEFSKVVHQLQADHIEPTVQETARGEKCDFVLPQDWPDERTTPYLAGLGWGIDPKDGGAEPDWTDTQE
jgi:hypothetical protein